MDKRTTLILEKLKTKACLKQKIYRNTMRVFKQLKEIGRGIADELAGHMNAFDESVEVVYEDLGEFEFRIKFSGDTLIFQMHSNVVTLSPDDPVFKNEYMLENEENSYFGSIRVYNFLSDSIKYNRLNDAGFLMARLLINRDMHYHIEAETVFKNLHPNIKKNIIDERHLTFFVQSAMLSAIDVDLVAPPYADIQIIPLAQQLTYNQGKAGSKLGFQMSSEA